MGTLKVIDNFLEKDLINFLCLHFKNVPHFYGESSNSKDENSIKFYYFNCNFQEPLYNFLCLKISKLFNYNLNIFRMHINVQHCFMDGDFHADAGDNTVLLMVTPTLLDNSGCFEIMENNNNKKIINFVQNRLIIFPATWKHRGCAPAKKNVLRITLVFKTKKHE
jgi:hypothetical protein